MFFSKLNDGKASVYKEFSQAMDKSLESSLLDDLKVINLIRESICL